MKDKTECCATCSHWDVSCTPFKELLVSKIYCKVYNKVYSSDHVCKRYKLAIELNY